MNVVGIISAITPVVTAFEELGIDYYIGGAVLDMEYLGRWATQLHVADLLDRALVDAGFSDAQ